MGPSGPDHGPGERRALAEPAAATAAPAWWRQPATTIPMVISLAAAVAACASVVVACAAYGDQQQANREQAAAQRDADVRLVSYDADPGNPKIVTIRNLSQQPLYQTSLTGSFILSGGHGSGSFVMRGYASVLLGQLAPCSTTTVDLQAPHLLARAADQPWAGSLPVPWRRAESAQVQWRTVALNFTDGNGLTWVVAEGRANLVTSQEILADAIPGDPTAPAHTTAAAGCS
jgi:hypothetical protein